MSTNENEGKLEIIGDAFKIIVLTAVITIPYIIWRLYEKDCWDTVMVKSGTVIPLSTVLSTILFQTGDWIMLGLTRRYKRRIKAEGKAEGIAEGKADMVAREAEWIEWAENGKDPEKMPSKVNPVGTTYNHESDVQIIKEKKMEI